MKKKVILYVVSTLARSGPTKQLSYIIKYLDKYLFDVHLVTLSPEPKNTLFALYKNMNVEVHTLKLSRLTGLFKGKKQLIAIIDELKPEIIHTQGIRADSLLAKISTNIPWLMTSRNYPYHDYPMKFGKIKGRLMANIHISAMKKCQNVIACSKTIETTLKEHNITVTSIQNGVCVENKMYFPLLTLSKYERPIFITTGSLIFRKNVKYIVNAFNLYAMRNKGSLLILGDGIEMISLQKIVQTPHIYFEGNVVNVDDYLNISDYFISASLSEGLPNTVLEALAIGLPSLLSDIPSHQEIANKSTFSCNIFKLGKGEAALSDKLESITDIFSRGASEEAKKTARFSFSAKVMSKKYQDKYMSLIK